MADTPTITTSGSVAPPSTLPPGVPHRQVIYTGVSRGVKQVEGGRVWCGVLSRLKGAGCGVGC